MIQRTFVAPLFDGPIDVIGDVHGEIGPLRELLVQLGYDAQGSHPAHRRLVFVGDLGDRGPDSPAVGEWVMELVGRGVAQCVLGNHELNLLRAEDKAGNAWFMNPDRTEQRPGGEFAHSQIATKDFKARYLAFLLTLPLVLERSDLRIVHAAWANGEIEVLRGALRSTLEVYRSYETQTEAQLRREGLKDRRDREKAEWRRALHDRHATVPLLTAIGESDERYQMGNPVRAVTSGVERLARVPFWSSGRWRMCDRVQWWEEYDEEVPVIMGHYWRRAKPIQGSDHVATKPDLFFSVGPLDWMGPKKNVFCVDYAIGARYDERKAGKSAFDTHLAAMRWPERELWFETGKAVN